MESEFFIVYFMLYNENTLVHDHIFTILCEVNVTDLTQNDPLCVGVIDLGSNRYQLSWDSCEGIAVCNNLIYDYTNSVNE